MPEFRSGNEKIQGAELGRVYKVYDVKADRWDPPIVRRNDQVAIRDLLDASAGPDHPWNLHGEDFSVYYMGDWDYAAGSLIEEANYPLGTFMQLRNRAQLLMQAALEQVRAEGEI